MARTVGGVWLEEVGVCPWGLYLALSLLPGSLEKWRILVAENVKISLKLHIAIE